MLQYEPIVGNGTRPNTKPVYSTDRGYVINSRGLDDLVVGRQMLKNNFHDTLLAFAEVVEHGKTLERGEIPDMHQWFLAELPDLKAAAVALRNGAYHHGKFPRLKEAVPHIDRYVGMVMQYAREANLSPNTNTIKHQVRQVKRWLGIKADDPRIRQVREWLGTPQPA